MYEVWQRSNESLHHEDVSIDDDDDKELGFVVERITFIIILSFFVVSYNMLYKKKYCSIFLFQCHQVPSM